MRSHARVSDYRSRYSSIRRRPTIRAKPPMLYRHRELAESELRTQRRMPLPLVSMHRAPSCCDHSSSPSSNAFLKYPTDCAAAARGIGMHSITVCRLRCRSLGATCSMNSTWSVESRHNAHIICCSPGLPHAFAAGPHCGTRQMLYNKLLPHLRLVCCEEHSLQLLLESCELIVDVLVALA